jgi:hypothetical protein
VWEKVQEEEDPWELAGDSVATKPALIGWRRVRRRSRSAERANRDSKDCSRSHRRGGKDGRDARGRAVGRDSWGAGWREGAPVVPNGILPKFAVGGTSILLLGVRPVVHQVHPMQICPVDGCNLIRLGCSGQRDPMLC